MSGFVLLQKFKHIYIPKKVRICPIILSKGVSPLFQSSNHFGDSFVRTTVQGTKRYVSYPQYAQNGTGIFAYVAEIYGVHVGMNILYSKHNLGILIYHIIISPCMDC